MTINKTLKLLKATAPELRWIREAKLDAKEDKKDPERVTHHSYAGLKGKNGIRCFLAPESPRELVVASARRLSRRLLRGE